MPNQELVQKTQKAIERLQEKLFKLSLEKPHSELGWAAHQKQMARLQENIADLQWHLDNPGKAK